MCAWHKDWVCAMCRVLGQLLPETREVLEAVERNRAEWVRVNRELLRLNLPRNMDLFSALSRIN